MSTTDTDVTFTSTRVRLFLARLGLGALGGACGVLVATAYYLLLAGRIDSISLLIYGVGYPLAFALFSLLFATTRPALIHLTTDGIELASSRCNPVAIEWANVASARFRRRWPFAHLEIVPVDPDAVTEIDRGGRRPATSRAAGRIGYVVDVDVLRDRRDVIRAELARRGCPLDAAQTPPG